jgi:uridylate kinase
MSYKRIVLKISGEALAAEKKTGFDFDFVSSVCAAVKKAADAGVQVGIVIGGGNFWRGVKDGAGKVERVSADRMGMLATCMNCLAVCDVFRQLGAKARVLTAVDIQGVGERYDTRKALEYLENGEIVLFAGGTGMPFFSTDTGAVLRAAEIHADAILLAKNIDGVYSADPRKDPDAVRFDRISYDEVLSRRLQVMDSTATAIAMDNSIPVLVFALSGENILRALDGEEIGTLVQ